MAVSYKGKRKLVHNGKEYIWNIRENYEGFFSMKFNVFHELHITAADKSFSTFFPLRPDDDEDYMKMKEYMGIDFDIPEAVTPSFVVKVIEWENRYYFRKGRDISPKCEKLAFGSDICYTVMKNGRDVLCVTVDETGNPFDDAYIFGEWLCIGCYDKVYIVDIETKKYTVTEVPMYFGYFRELGDRLYIFTGVGVIAYDRDMHRLWQNDALAVDGVTGGELTEDGRYLMISCEMDPPGGWVDKMIDTETGR